MNFHLNQSLAKFTIYIEMRRAKLSFVDRPQEWNKEHIGTFKLNSEKNGYYSIKKMW
jgi:hypothetical protein